MKKKLYGNLDIDDIGHLIEVFIETDIDKDCVRCRRIMKRLEKPTKNK